MIGMCKESVQSAHDSVETLCFADGDSALKIFDVEKDRSGLIQIVNHIVDGRTTGCSFVRCTEKLTFC